ncbi:MAG: hypothetical protein WA110_02260 [Anaerolineaceae bacterium]
MDCPVFTSDPDQKMPGELINREAKGPRRKRQRLFFLIPVILLLVAALILIFIQHGKNTPMGSGSQETQVPTVKKSLTQFAVINLSTPTATQTSTPTKSFTPTKTSLPTPTPTLIELREPHFLDTPFGNDYKFIIHKAASGESIQLFATQYNTTPDVIKSVNYQLYVPIWVDSIIIIPMDIIEVGDLPAFELYYIEAEGLTMAEVATNLAVDIEDLTYYNDLEPEEELQLGEWLLIPRERNY